MKTPDELAQQLIDNRLCGYTRPRLEKKATAFLVTLVEKLEKLGSSSVSDELLKSTDESLVKFKQSLDEGVPDEAVYRLALVTLLMEFRLADQKLKKAAKKHMQWDLAVDSPSGCDDQHVLGGICWNALKLHFVKSFEGNEGLREAFCRVMKRALVEHKVDVIMLQEIPRNGKTVEMLVTEINRMVVKNKHEFYKQTGLFVLKRPKDVNGRVVSSTHALLVRNVEGLTCEDCWCMDKIERLDAGCSDFAFDYPPLVATFSDTRYKDLSLQRQVFIGVHTPGTSTKQSQDQRDREMNAMYREGPGQVSATQASLDIRATFPLCPYGIYPPMSLQYCPR